MNYLHEVVDISRGQRPSEIFTTEGNVRYLAHIYTIMRVSARRRPTYVTLVKGSFLTIVAQSTGSSWQSMGGGGGGGGGGGIS